MLPIVLVLLVAPSAFSFPTVGVTQYAFQDVASLKDSGRLVSRYVTRGIFELIDGGEKTVYELNMGQIVDDIANLPDSTSQAIAIAVVLSVLGETSGIPGDSCTAAAAINDVVSEVSTGQGIAAWNSRLAFNLDNLGRLATNPESLKYITGPQGKCPGGGRTFQFEAVWDKILNSSNPYNYGLLNELYCATKRLYQSINIRSNNIASAITASCTQPIINVIHSNLPAYSRLMKLAIAGAPPKALAQATADCKTGLQ